jgi:hypothetical protein
VALQTVSLPKGTNDLSVRNFMPTTLTITSVCPTSPASAGGLWEWKKV